MNGRIYDAMLGRFLSADQIIQAPGNLQSYNRYSYCMNSPLGYTDPSGYLSDAEKAALDNFGIAGLNMGDAINEYADAIERWMDKRLGGMFSKCSQEDYYQAEASQSETQKLASAASDLIVETDQATGAMLLESGNVVLESMPIVGAGYELITGKDFLGRDTSRVLAGVGLLGGELGGIAAKGGRVLRSGIADIAGDFARKVAPALKRIEAMGAKAGGVIDEIGRRVDDSKISWPVNRGFVFGEGGRASVLAGQTLDRFGGTGGRFLAPGGTPVPMRSLAPGIELKPLNSFEVLKPFEADAGSVAPWFGQPGGGLQFDLGKKTVQDLIETGFLRQKGS
jgi:hypothetical protein